MGLNFLRPADDDREREESVPPSDFRIAMRITAIIVGLPLASCIGWCAVSEALLMRDWEMADQTIDDIWTTENALEVYAAEHLRYPIAVSTWGELEAIPVPRYVESLPEHDAWGTRFVVHTSDTGDSYEIVSLGKDRRPGERTGGDSDDFARDIVSRTGWLYQWPRDPTAWP